MCSFVSSSSSSSSMLFDGVGVVFTSSAGLREMSADR